MGHLSYKSHCRHIYVVHQNAVVVGWQNETRGTCKN